MVVRTALYVDPETAQVSAVSDPIPTILQGIPLDIRSIVAQPRPAELHPQPDHLRPDGGHRLADLGHRPDAPLSTRFQVGDCERLGFKPKLALGLKGGTKRGGHPALKAVADAARRATPTSPAPSVALPHSEFLDKAHIGNDLHQGPVRRRRLPGGLDLRQGHGAHAAARQAAEGPVYLRSSSNKLPDLVADLNGQIDVVLVGRIDSIKGGGIRTTFEAVPDAPVSKFVLEMQGGKKGLLTTASTSARRATGRRRSSTARTARASTQRPLVANSCKKGKQGASAGKQRRARADR